MAGQPAVALRASQESLVDFGRNVIRREASTLALIADRLDGNFAEAAEAIYRCRGSVFVCGLGKAGLIGQKIAATFASLGTRSHFLHPAEGLHGDLGRVHSSDLVLALSYSGETQEVVAICRILRTERVPIVAITRCGTSSLGRLADWVIALGSIEEACPLGLAPTSSTTAMLAVGDALALAVAQLRRFTPDDFARFHPGGSLGRKLAFVEECMRPLNQCRIAEEHQTVREVLVRTARPGRRTGAIMVVDEAGRLSGIFTDSDLARLFERRADDRLDRPIAEVMTRQPITILAGSRLADAVSLMAERKISELPVLDLAGRPVGIIDVTDLVALWPEYFADHEPSGPTLSLCTVEETTSHPSNG